MATAGIFQLLINEGKQDEMLMSTSFLQERLKAISAERKAANLSPVPNLADIEKTHILFMNAHFKPFVAIGYEYQKVRPSSGNIVLSLTQSTTAQFQIPQFGDFFHDMVLHIKLTGASCSSANTAWRWADFPGERLVEYVKFSVNGNNLDEYYSEDVVMWRNFELPVNKIPGYYRCVGQQLPESYLVNCPTNTLPEPSPIHMTVTRGHQSSKSNVAHQDDQTDDLDLTVPLHFWFNKDPRLMIPSVAIPFGQRFIDVQLTAMQNMLGTDSVGTITRGGSETFTLPSVTTFSLYVNNVFVNPEIHDIYIKRIGFNLIRVHRRQVTRLNASSGEILLNNLKWPIEFFYFAARPLENITAVTGVITATNAYETRLLQDWCVYSKVLPEGWATRSIAAFPAGSADECVLVGKDLFNTFSQVTLKLQGINLYSEFPAQLLNQYLPFHYSGYALNTPVDPGPMMLNFALYPCLYQPSGHINVSRAREIYLSYTANTDADGNSMIGTTAVGNDTNGNAAVTSADVNAGTGVLYPTNTACMTRTASATNADLIVSASCINFLLISDGSAVLRYST